ncbi:hypothetical protein L0F63_004780 [Massospora cicadina]|nr:hypothetical protein L0F63_004780 [Massospora cicadina]
MALSTIARPCNEGGLGLLDTRSHATTIFLKFLWPNVCWDATPMPQWAPALRQSVSAALGLPRASLTSLGEWLTNHPGHRLKPSSSPCWNQALLALKRVGARIHHAFPYRREGPGLSPRRHEIVHNGQVVTTRLNPQDRPPIHPRLLELLPPSVRFDLKELWKDVYHPILSAKVSSTLWRVLHCLYRTGDRTGPTFQHRSCPRCVEPIDSHLHRPRAPPCSALTLPGCHQPLRVLAYATAIWTIHNSFLRAAFDQQVWTLPHMITHFQVHFEMALKVCTMSPTLPRSVVTAAQLWRSNPLPFSMPPPSPSLASGS